MSNTNKVNIMEENCPKNHKCPAVKKCPVGAISQEGNSAPKIDHDKCILCGICVKSCPKKVFHIK